MIHRLSTFLFSCRGIIVAIVIILFFLSIPVVSFYTMKAEDGRASSSDVILKFWREEFQQALKTVRIVSSLDRLHSSGDDPLGLQEVVIGRINEGVDFEIIIHGLEISGSDLTNEEYMAHHHEILKWLKQLAGNRKLRLYILAIQPPADFCVVDCERIFIIESIKRQNYSRSKLNPKIARILLDQFKDYKSIAIQHL